MVYDIEGLKVLYIMYRVDKTSKGQSSASETITYEFIHPA